MIARIIANKNNVLMIKFRHGVHIWYTVREPYRPLRYFEKSDRRVAFKHWRNCVALHAE